MVKIWPFGQASKAAKPAEKATSRPADGLPLAPKTIDVDSLPSAATVPPIRS